MISYAPVVDMKPTKPGAVAAGAVTRVVSKTGAAIWSAWFVPGFFAGSSSPIPILRRRSSGLGAGSR